MDPVRAALRRCMGSAIAQRRKAAGLSQDDVAQCCGLTRTSIVNVEAGRQELPVRKLVLVGEALGCDYRELMPPPEVLRWLDGGAT